MSRPPTPALLLAGAASLTLLAGCETMADIANDSAYEAALTGAAEVPGPGDPDGMGNAEFTFDWVSGNMCYEMDVANIGQPTAAHIHRGGPGVAGPPVVTLEVPDVGDSDNSECQEVSAAIRDEIRGSPSNFYVNVHNDDYPAGAIRGQLQP